MASESLQCKTLVLRVSIHCEGCKKKVKKMLQSVEGVYKCDIDARSNKATVAVTGKVSADALIKKLRRSGKHAGQWPEEQKQQHRPTDTQSQEAKNQITEPGNPGEPTDRPASGDAVTNAEEPNNPKTSEEPKSSGETAKPDQESTESASVSVNGNADADGNVSHGGTKEATAEQSIEPKRKRKHQQQQEKPLSSKAAAVPDQASYVGHLPPPLQQQPVHVMSYNVARPSASAAFYAAAPAAVPASRPPPPQEHSYSYSHSPYYYYSQPSPYRYDYHYGHGTPQRSAASPARDSYGDLFSDDNANSCSVM